MSDNKMTSMDHFKKVHVRNLFDEIRDNGGPAVGIMDIPLRMLFDLLKQAAARAAEIGDMKLVSIFCRMAIYDISDPTHPDFDQDEMNQLLSKYPDV